MQAEVVTMYNVVKEGIQIEENRVSDPGVWLTYGSAYTHVSASTDVGLLSRNLGK